MPTRKRPSTLPTPEPSKPSAVFGIRLRAARERRDLSQEQLAATAGIDEFSASARISQYETGKHTPRYEIACRLADVLCVPVAYLYANDRETSELLLLWHAASPTAKREALRALTG